MNHAYEGRIPTQKLMAIATAVSLNNSHTTWLSNTGASNHITLDLANLAIHNEYHGQDQVVVGNGAGLNIAHIGSNTIPHGSSSLAMNNILHCPSVTANLLSVYQFTRDNNCYFIFFSNCFYVKDLSTGRMLFRRKSETSLYPFHIHSRFLLSQVVRLHLLVFVLVLQFGILSWVILPPTHFCILFQINVFL